VALLAGVLAGATSCRQATRAWLIRLLTEAAWPPASDIWLKELER
jgi:hypothetical protein